MEDFEEEYDEDFDLEAWRKKHRDFIVNGLQTGKIYPYPDRLYDILRPYSYGGVPLPILLHVTDLDDGECYDRAILMQLAFRNCRMVYANINTLRVSDGEEYAEHAYIETSDFDGGKTIYVVDTSLGLIIEKEYFDEHECPTINEVYSKEECMADSRVQKMLASDFEKDKWSLVLTLPLIEKCIKNSNRIGVMLYREKLEEEVEKLKKAINYDQMQKEVEEDMKLMWTDPETLDKKFKIVRDEFGQEKSRGGVKNPFYRKIDKKSLSLKDEGGEIKLTIPDEKTIKRIVKAEEKEYEKVLKRASKRLKEIKKDPLKDVYATDQPDRE